MSKKLFADIPEFVRITIYSQVRSLLNTPYFRHENDTDDIVQDLLLYYLEKFYNKPAMEEPYVIASIQHEAQKLLRAKMRRRFGLHFSLEDLLENHEAFMAENTKETDFDLFVSLLSRHFSDKENRILRYILEGHSIDGIAKEMHLSKATIYKFFDKMKKNFKK